MKKRDMPIDSFTKQLEVAFARRGKAIKHRGVKVAYRFVAELSADRKSETTRFEVRLAYRIRGSLVMIGINSWNDRWLWLDARRQNKSFWDYQLTLEGRAMPNVSAREIVTRVEQTLDLTSGADRQSSEEIEKLWHKILARGPVAMHE